MIRSLALALFVVAALPAQAQDAAFAEEPEVAWERTVGGRGGDRVAALAAADGGVAAAGTLFAGGEDEGDAWVALYDAQGVGQWQRSAGGSGEQGYVAVAAASGTIIAAGQDDATLAPMIEAHDTEGRRIWATADAPGDDTTVLGAATAGQDMIMTGAERSDDGARGMVLALDPATGAMRWRFADTGPADSAFLAAGPQDDALLVTGWAEVPGDAGNADRKRPVLLRLGSGGDLIWRRVLGPDDEEGAFHALSPRPGGGAVLAGTAVLGTGQPVPRVMAVDGDGDFVWEYRPEDAVGSGLGVAALPGGGAVVAGYLLAQTGPTRRAWLARIDAEGGLTWQKTFDQHGDGAIHAVVLSDGALVAAGSRVVDETGEDGWLLKLR